MRLIDADSLADALFEKRKNYPQWVADTICNMPEAVVRCKDCKYWSDERILDYKKCKRWINVGVKNFATRGDWFCADGERKSD